MYRLAVLPRRDPSRSRSPAPVANTDPQNGVLVSDPKGRDLKIDSYTLSYHGRLLIEGAEISLNYGNRLVPLKLLCPCC